jgi:hypothetical protein
LCPNLELEKAIRGRNGVLSETAAVFSNSSLMHEKIEQFAVALGYDAIIRCMYIATAGDPNEIPQKVRHNNVAVSRAGPLIKGVISAAGSIVRAQVRSSS